MTIDINGTTYHTVTDKQMEDLIDIISKSLTFNECKKLARQLNLTVTSSTLDSYYISKYDYSYEIASYLVKYTNNNTALYTGYVLPNDTIKLVSHLPERLQPATIEFILSIKGIK